MRKQDEPSDRTNDADDADDGKRAEGSAEERRDEWRAEARRDTDVVAQRDATTTGQHLDHHAEQNPAQPVGPAGQPTNRPAYEGHEGVTPTGEPGIGVSHGEGNPLVATTEVPDQARVQKFTGEQERNRQESDEKDPGATEGAVTRGK